MATWMDVMYPKEQRFDLAVKVQPGEKYVLSTKSTYGELGVWFEEDTFLGFLEDGEIKFTATPQMAEKEYITLSSTEPVPEQDFAIKLEKGNKATDWTPAPEDMVEFIDNTAARIEEQVSELTVSLDGITSKVSTVETEIDGLREHTETWIQQTSSELSVQITDSLSSLEEDLIQRFQSNIEATAEDLLLTFTGFQDSLEGLSEDIAYFQTTFRLSSEGLEIGRAEDPFKLFLTNNRMSFLDSGTEVAYVSDRKMFITEAEITNSFKVGSHLIERYSNEITLVRWVG